MWSKVLLFGVFIVGCDQVSDSPLDSLMPDTALPDSAVPDMALVDMVLTDMTVPHCEITTEHRLKGVEGGRVRGHLMIEGPVAELSWTLPEGWRGTLEEGEFDVRPAYVGQAQTVEIPLAYTCDGQAEQGTLPIDVSLLYWTQITPWRGDGGPIAREYFSMWIDPADSERLMVFGGFHYVPQQFTVAWDTWVLDLESEQWAAMEPAGTAPQLAGGGIASLPDASTSFYYGGLSAGNTLPFSIARFDYGGLPTWRTLQIDDVGEGTYQPAFFYDAPRDRFLAIGGQGPEATHMTVHAFDHRTSSWSEVPVADGPEPTGRTGFFWAYDPATDRFVAFGGDQGGEREEHWDCDCAEDTWALELGEDPPRWVQLAGPQDPLIGRRNGAFTLDPIGHRLLVWGGTADGANTFEGLFALDLDRGHEGWTQVETVDMPPQRSSGAGVYDAPRQRVLMGFGNGARTYGDLWALHLTPPTE